MKSSLKKLFSQRLIVVVLVVLLVMTILNTFLILQGTRDAMSSNVVNYDYVLSQDGNTYKLKDMRTGDISGQPNSASTALNSAMIQGKSVYLNDGTYTLTDDVYVNNKLNPKIVSDGATIDGDGHKIVVFGDDYTTSQYALISGLTIINATVRIENSFAATIADTKFINSTVGIEFANTNTWSEYNKIENCQFINDTTGIAFRTPVNGTQIGENTGNATGSYASSVIERCSFNIQDFSVGISVEPLAEFSDSQIMDTRFWMGEDNFRSNQTGLLVAGSMYQTLLQGVVFESFSEGPIYMFAMDIAETCDPAPVFDGGVSFLGTWTARVHNPYSVLLPADGAVFRWQNEAVPVGVNNEYGANISLQCKPLKISDFKPKISVSGSFSHSETITVRVRIEWIDNAVTKGVTKTFTTSGSEWLTDDDMLSLFPSQSVIWQILVDAKTNTASTDAKVSVSGYGIAE